MTTLTQTYGAGEPLVSSLPWYSNSEVTVLSGQDLAANTVIGMVTKAAAGGGVADGGNTGNATVGSITIASNAKPGAHIITALTATTFSVVDPDGVNLGTATAGSAFAGGGVTFTVTAGGTPMVAGDFFTLTVTGGQMKAWSPASSDGSQTVAGILLYAVDATAGDTPGAAIRRLASVNPAELSYAAGLTEGAKLNALAGLAALGIVTR
jgi:hypothetical protein